MLEQKRLRKLTRAQKGSQKREGFQRDSCGTALFRPAPDVCYEHIDELFTAQVDWDLIATLVADMVRGGIDSNRQYPAFRYSPPTQQQLTQEQALLRIPGTGPSSPDDFLVALSLRCGAAPHDPSGH